MDELEKKLNALKSNKSKENKKGNFKMLIITSSIILLMFVFIKSIWVSRECGCYEDIKKQINNKNRRGFLDETCMRMIPEINTYIEKNQNRAYGRMTLEQRERALLRELKRLCDK